MTIEPVPEAVGVVGLGNMGAALAANLVGAGFDVIAHDLAGPDRLPPGARFAPALPEVADAEVVVLSLPDGQACEAVAAGLAAAARRRTTHVVDTSTVGVAASQSIAAHLAQHGVAYVDAPVSGGVAGARARTLTVMVAGSDDASAHVEGVLAGVSDVRLRVGDRPGMAQALKLANNFLSATALAATSEAVAFGVSVGLDMARMLDVLNRSSGRNGATLDKFPDHVLTGRYASGFTNTLMAKDTELYLEAAAAEGAATTFGAATAAQWRAFAAARPGEDFTAIYPYVAAPEETP